jgi:hypothetical protein
LSHYFPYFGITGELAWYAACLIYNENVMFGKWRMNIGRLPVTQIKDIVFIGIETAPTFVGVFSLQIIEYELDQLDRQGYNPITEVYMAPVASVQEDSPTEITTKTPLVLALKRALIYCISDEVIRDQVKCWGIAENIFVCCF